MNELFSPARLVQSAAGTNKDLFDKIQGTLCHKIKIKYL